MPIRRAVPSQGPAAEQDEFSDFSWNDSEELQADSSDIQAAGARFGSNWTSISGAEAVSQLTSGSNAQLQCEVDEARQALTKMAPVAELWAASVLQYAHSAHHTAEGALFAVSCYVSSVGGSHAAGPGARGTPRARAPSAEEATAALQLLFSGPDVEGYVASGGQRILGDGGDWYAPPLMLHDPAALPQLVEEALAGFTEESAGRIMMVVQHLLHQLHDLKVAAEALLAACAGCDTHPLGYRNVAQAVLALRSSGPPVSFAGCLALPDDSPWSTAVRACDGWGCRATLLGSKHVKELPLGPLLRALSIVAVSEMPHFDLHGVQVCAEAYCLRMEADGPVAAFWIGKPGTCKTTTARTILPRLFCPWGEQSSLLTPAITKSSAVVRVLGQSTMQLSCSETVTAIPAEYAGVDEEQHLGSTVIQCALSPWSCGAVMGYDGRGLPLSVLVLDEGGRLITANALSNRRESRTSVRSQSKLQKGPLFDYLSTARPWGDNRYALRYGRTDRVFVVFTGNTDERGEVESAMRQARHHAGTAAVMGVVDKSLAGLAEGFILDRCVNGLRTQLVELDTARLMRNLVVPKVIQHLEQAAVMWGRSRQEGYRLGFAGQVRAAASALGVVADEDTVQAAAQAMLAIDVSAIVENMTIPEGITARSLQSEMPNILGFPTQQVLDRTLLQWAVQDISRVKAFGALQEGLFAVLRPGTQEVQFMFAAEPQMLAVIAEGALVLKSLDNSKALSDVVPLPQEPHMIVIEQAIASASGSVRRVQQQVEGLRLGGRTLGQVQQSPETVEHTLAFSNAAVSLYRTLIQQRPRAEGPPCHGLAFHVSPADPAQLLIVQCPEKAYPVNTDTARSLYGGNLVDGVHLCGKVHKCGISGGRSQPTGLHPMEVALTLLQVREGVLSRLASLVVQAAHSSQLLVPGSPVHAPFALGCAGGSDGKHHAQLAAAASMDPNFWEPQRFNVALAAGGLVEKAALLDLLLLVTPVGMAAGSMLSQYWVQHGAQSRTTLKRSLLEGQVAALQQQFTLAKPGSGTAVNISPPEGGVGAGAAGGNTLLPCLAEHTGTPGKQKLTGLLSHLKAEAVGPDAACLLEQVSGTAAMAGRVIRVQHCWPVPNSINIEQVSSYGSFWCAPYADAWRVDLQLYTRGRNRVVLWLSLAMAAGSISFKWLPASTVVDMDAVQLYRSMAVAAAGEESEWAHFFSSLLKCVDDEGMLTSVELPATSVNAVLSYLPPLPPPPTFHGLPSTELLFEQAEATGVLVAASKAYQALPDWQVSARASLLKCIKWMAARPHLGPWGIALSSHEVAALPSADGGSRPNGPSRFNRKTASLHRRAASGHLSTEQQEAIESVMMRAAGTAHTKTAARDEQVLLEFCEAGGADSVDSYARDQLRQGLAPRTVANKLITVQRYLHVLLDEDSSQAAAAGTIARRLVTVAAHIDHLNHVPAALNAQGAFVPASGEERVQAQLEYALQDALYSMCLLPSDHSIQQGNVNACRCEGCKQVRKYLRVLRIALTLTTGSRTSVFQTAVSQGALNDESIAALAAVAERRSHALAVSHPPVLVEGSDGSFELHKAGDKSFSNFLPVLSVPGWLSLYVNIGAACSKWLLQRERKTLLAVLTNFQPDRPVTPGQLVFPIACNPTAGDIEASVSIKCRVHDLRSIRRSFYGAQERKHGFFNPTSAYIRNDVAVVTQNHSWTTEKKFYLHRCVHGFRVHLELLGKHVDQYIPTQHIPRWLRSLAEKRKSTPQDQPLSGSQQVAREQLTPMESVLRLKRLFESGAASEAECLAMLGDSPSLQKSFQLFARKQTHHVKNAARLKTVQDSADVQWKLGDILCMPIVQLESPAVFWFLTGCVDVSFLNDMIRGHLILHPTGKCGALTRVNKHGQVVQLRLSAPALEYVECHGLPSSVKLSDLQTYFNCTKWRCKELREAILRICIQHGIGTLQAIIVSANRWAGAKLQKVSDLTAASISHGMGNVYRG